MGIRYLNFFGTISTIKDQKSAAKFHYIKTVSGKVVAQSIAFRVVTTRKAIDYATTLINILAGGSSVPLISEC